MIPIKKTLRFTTIDASNPSITIYNITFLSIFVNSGTVTITNSIGESIIVDSTNSRVLSLPYHYFYGWDQLTFSISPGGSAQIVYSN